MSAARAILVEDVWKRFRLYHERNQSLKASLMRGRRARYDEFWALSDVSFEIEEGTSFGLVGENGSGKSTMLKCIANILRPDRGRIAVDGRVSALLELGAGFHPELSGRENVYLNGAILGLSRKQIAAKFDEIVEFADLAPFIDTPVKNYSSGMYVRLGFSVAISVDPDILLIDEILAVGDEEFQKKSAEKFHELRERGKTIVIVSHALEAIRNFCDRAVLLGHGKVRSIGPAPKVIQDYLDGVHIDRSAGNPGQRVGSGEIRFTRLELLDRDGKVTTRTRTGEKVTLRLHYEASEPIERPVFGVGIGRIDGVGVTGPNTRDYNVIPDKLDGRGHVDFKIERLLLLRGTYDVMASIYDYTQSHQYDGIIHALRFDVERGTPAEQLGVVSLGGEWEIVEEDPS